MKDSAARGEPGSVRYRPGAVVARRYDRLRGCLHYTGRLLEIMSLVLLLPLPVVGLYWGQYGDGARMVTAFVVPALVSYAIGTTLRRRSRAGHLDLAGSMLVCAVCWLACSAVGALPFCLGHGAGYLDAYFEAMSGFTTTGTTIFSGLEFFPRSLLFWRALTHWLGGLGILSLFLALSFQGSDTHLLLGAESHKVTTRRPAPGLHHTVSILWGIYTLFGLLAILTLGLAGMPWFDSICYALAALSTGGFSPQDASLVYYQQLGLPHLALIEYLLVFWMILGGMNFLVHYRVLKGDARALFDHLEVRWWWWLIGGFTALITVECLLQQSWFTGLAGGLSEAWRSAEEAFRHSLFQVVSVITTTGFTSQDIGSPYFGGLARQLFLAMMIIGGCVGSTSGGIKVFRIAILNRMIFGELFKCRVSPRASNGIVLDGKLMPEAEVDRISALFYAWMALLILGGGITALFTHYGALESFSGMCSALGNVGPSFLSVAQVISLPAVVKVTYIIGMLAGRLEILPVLLLFSRRAWQ